MAARRFGFGLSSPASAAAGSAGASSAAAGFFLARGGLASALAAGLRRWRGDASPAASPSAGRRPGRAGVGRRREGGRRLGRVLFVNRHDLFGLVPRPGGPAGRVGRRGRPGRAVVQIDAGPEGVVLVVVRLGRVVRSGVRVRRVVGPGPEVVPGLGVVGVVDLGGGGRGVPERRFVFHVGRVRLADHRTGDVDFGRDDDRLEARPAVAVAAPAAAAPALAPVAAIPAPRGGSSPAGWPLPSVRWR